MAGLPLLLGKRESTYPGNDAAISVLCLQWSWTYLMEKSMTSLDILLALSERQHSLFELAQESKRWATERDMRGVWEKDKLILAAEREFKK